MFYFNNGVLTVARYQRICALSEDEVVISLKNYSIVVRGSCLCLIYLEDIEVRINGKIESITLGGKIK